MVPVELAPATRFCERQHAAGVGVAGCRAGAEDRRVQLGRAPEMARVVAEVARRGEPVADLALHG